jgi:REP element-mobilizing transposase RayT
MAAVRIAISRISIPGSLRSEKRELNSRIMGWCFLPEHLHCIWSLPEGEADYPLRWEEIKRLFTKAYPARVGAGEEAMNRLR